MATVSDLSLLAKILILAGLSGGYSTTCKKELRLRVKSRVHHVVEPKEFISSEAT